MRSRARILLFASLVFAGLPATPARAQAECPPGVSHVGESRFCKPESGGGPPQPPPPPSEGGVGGRHVRSRGGRWTLPALARRAQTTCAR